MKKLICITVLIFFICSLSSCSTINNANTYQEAVSALNNYDYYNAITLFESLGDYEDSRQQLEISIDKYISKLIENNNWNEALVFLNKYQTLVEDDIYTDRYISAIDEYINILIDLEEWEKAKSILNENNSFDIQYIYDYVVYSEAISYFENNTESDYEQGFKLLSLIKDNSEYFNNVQNIKNGYQKLLNSDKIKPFIGTWETWTVAMGLRFDTSMTFKLHFKDESFKIICTETTTQDRYVTSSNYYFDLEDFYEDRAIYFHYSLFPLPSSLKNLVVLVELSLPCGKLSSLRE